jgi:UDP-N-acetylglucosamine 2-epimerase
MNNLITFVHILAARPNFIKASPLINEISKNGYKNIIIHTNQHYDYLMSKIFFGDLNIPKPDFNLGIKSGTHAEQTGRAMIEIENILLDLNPQFLVIYGDVNSSLAGALAGSKLKINIIHIESGCRSFDRTMPEEINRILIDNLSDLLFCTEESAYNNLVQNGFKKKSVFNVGNTAIDSLFNLKINKSNYKFKYYVCTLHRPFNVDDKEKLGIILKKLDQFDNKVIIPTHPRLMKNIDRTYNNLLFIDPLGYLDFISLLKYSEGVISDSGGVQCEASFLGIPMLTLRKSTEHLITLSHGNKLIDIKDLHFKNFNPKIDKQIPKEWDGKASIRIVKRIKLKYKI